jgi:hypothetical protein
MSLLALGAGTAHAQSAEAERLYNEAEALLAAGQTAEACAAYEESNRLESGAGVLIKIGSCKEKLGKLASSLAAFRAALARVKDPNKRKIATTMVAALEPRVSHLTITVKQRARVEGLSLTLDGQPLDPSDYDRPIEIDGGSHKIAASAPGYERWSVQIEVAAEKDKAVAEVRGLVEKARADAEPETRAEPEKRVEPEAAAEPLKERPSPMPPPRPPARRLYFRVLMWSAVGVAVAGGIYWGYGVAQVRDAERRLCSGRYEDRLEFDCLNASKITRENFPIELEGMNDSQIADLQAERTAQAIPYDEQGKRWSRRVANQALPITAIGGTLAIIGLIGGYVWSYDDGASPRSASIAPSFGPDGAGAVVRFDW